MVDYHSSIACCVWHITSPDPLFLHNPVPIVQRLDYYGITWIPDLAINGAGIGYEIPPFPGEYQSMASFIDSCRAIPSPLIIDCSAVLAGDVHASIEVTVETPIVSGDPRLFVALIEDYIYLPSPNGETDHHYTFRWINNGNDATGEPIDLSSTGTQHFEYVLPFFEDIYQVDQLSVTVWVQDYATNGVIQAGKATVPGDYYLSMHRLGPAGRIGGASQPVEFEADIENLGTSSDVCDISVGGVPAGWSCTYTTPQGTFSGPSALPLASGEIAPLLLVVDSQGHDGPATVTLHAVSQSTPLAADSLAFTKMNGLDVLLVDDDGGEARESFIEPALATAGIEWGTWCLLDGALTATSLQHAARAVLWSCGVGYADSTLSALDRAALAGYMDGGGHVLVGGCDVAFDLASPSSPHATPESAQWLEERLHATFERDFSLSYTVDGTVGDPIGDGFDDVALAQSGDNAQASQDGLTAAADASVVLTWTGFFADDACVRWEGTGGRVVYAAFGIDGIEPAETRALFVERVLGWFGATTSAERVPAAAVSPLGLRAAPNPFTDRTAIRYQLDGATPATLRIYDALGRTVRTLAHTGEPRHSGTLVWDGADQLGRPVARGVYFCRLEVPSGTATLRIVRDR
jgi:hypothetical protein